MVTKGSAILLVITLISYTHTNNPKTNNINTNVSRRSDAVTEPSKGKQSKFQEYLKKFEPSTIWEQLDKQRKYHGLIISDQELMDVMCQRMDPTDEILKLQIENGDAKIIHKIDGRRRPWVPPKRLSRVKEDPFYLRRRLYELMKQTIYQTRNKMIIMQEYRRKYNQSALYKMGFLFNKADTAAKTFGKYSYRAFRGCLTARERVISGMNVFDFLSINERQLHLWFNVELLVDLIRKNDKICREVFVNHTSARMLAFDDAFIP